MSSYESLTQHHFDQLLVRFGERLQCQTRYYEEGKHLADMVFRTLLKHTPYSLASFHIGGSFGKKTDVIEPDLDLVVLVNNCHPPLEPVLNDFENILRCNEEELTINPGVYKKTKLSLHFSFTNGIEVDLLPAANIEDYREMHVVIQEMKCDHKYAYFYNPSFVKKQIAFLKTQDIFTHTLARLSKFWLKSLYLGESFTGGSAIMEMIAVAAAEIEQECSQTSASRAFMRVLETIMNLGSTKLAFWHYKCDRNIEKWKRVAPDELNNINHNQLVPKIVGKYEILQRRYFMIDPANPFQDYLEDKTDSVMRTLCEFARLTRSRLDQILNGHGIHDQDIHELFKPLPDILTTYVSTIFLPKNVLLTHDEFCMAVHNEVNVNLRNIHNGKENEARRAVKILKNNLLTIVHATVDGKLGNVPVNDVKNAVLKLIGHNSKICMKHTANPDDHNCQYDATVRVPYVINGASYAVCLSMTWNPSFPADLSEQTTDRRHSAKSPNCCECLCLIVVIWIVLAYMLK